MELKVTRSTSHDSLNSRNNHIAECTNVRRRPCWRYFVLVAFDGWLAGSLLVAMTAPRRPCRESNQRWESDRKEVLQAQQCQHWEDWNQKSHRCFPPQSLDSNPTLFCQFHLYWEIQKHLNPVMMVFQVSSDICDKGSVMRREGPVWLVCCSCCNVDPCAKPKTVALFRIWDVDVTIVFLVCFSHWGVPYLLR